MIFISYKRWTQLNEMFQLKIDMFSFFIYKHVTDKCGNLKDVIQYLQYRRKC